MKSFLLYGPPASGKSTVAKKISEKIGSVYVSIGQITRSEIAKKSEKGLLLKKYLDDVVEYPIELISSVVEDRLNELQTKEYNGFILDGFPKYEWEATHFLKMVKNLSLKIDGVVVIDVPLGEIIKRASGRRICQSCLKEYDMFVSNIVRCPECMRDLSTREDDTVEVLERRYNDYSQSIKQTIKVLGNNCGKVIVVDGTGSQDDI
ncbi:hypothetical protein D4R99_02225, partial [bacterium]